MGREGRISGHYSLQTYFYLERLGYTPDPRLFGLKSWSQLYPPTSANGSTKRGTG